MKKPIVYLFALTAITAVSCGGKTQPQDNAADSGQVHVGSTNPEDTAKYPATPNETGGKDTSGNGAGSTNPTKDTLKTNP